MGSLYFESFACLPWHMLIHCGKWEEIINGPLKEGKDVYAGTITTAHFARAIAFAITGRIKEARQNFVNMAN